MALKAKHGYGASGHDHQHSIHRSPFSRSWCLQIRCVWWNSTDVSWNSLPCRSRLLSPGLHWDRLWTFGLRDQQSIAGETRNEDSIVVRFSKTCGVCLNVQTNLTDLTRQDYFGGVLWSKLMGPGVAHALSNTSVRAYAHCHATNSSDLTVLLLNLDTTEPSFVTIDMATTAVEQAGSSPTFEYHLTGKPHQQTVKLNGKTLAATVEGVLPPMFGQAGVSTAVQLAPVRPCMQLLLFILIRQTDRVQIYLGSPWTSSQNSATTLLWYGRHQLHLSSSRVPG